MYSFNNDYSEGACPEVLEALIQTNNVQSIGYGLDAYSDAAKEKIKDKIQRADCDVHFLVGGTQANLTVIGSILRPYEAVMAVDSGHINVHETGSIEATGHKVVVCEGVDGKLTPKGIQKAVEYHCDEHMVKPKLVYISNATEIGTIYSKQELKELREVCDRYDLYLFMDGARLPMALTAQGNDVTLPDLAAYCDVFYLGGTKCGALFGEAVVILRDELKKDFRFMMKQRGGMLAKGRLLGVQFSALMESDVYFAYARHANAMAQKLQKGMKELGISFLIDSPTNQIFPILEDTMLPNLQEHTMFQVWEKVDATHTAIRLVTSWATPEKEVDSFLSTLSASCQS